MTRQRARRRHCRRWPQRPGGGVLPRQGRQEPLVLEKRERVGGGAATEEIAPGFRAPILAHADRPAPAGRRARHAARAPRAVAHRAGTRTSSRCRRTAARSRSRAIPRRTATSIAAFSQRDAAALPGVPARRWRGRAVCFERLLDAPPPDIDRPSPSDLWSLLQTGRRFRATGQARRIPASPLDADGGRRLRRRMVRDRPAAGGDRLARHTRRLSRAVVGRNGGSPAARRRARSAARRRRDHRARRAGRARVGARQRGRSRRRADTHGRARQSRDRVATARRRAWCSKTAKRFRPPRSSRTRIRERTFLDLVDPLDLEPGFAARVRNYRAMGTVAKVNWRSTACRRSLRQRRGQRSRRVRGPDSHRSGHRLSRARVRRREVRRRSPTIRTSTSTIPSVARSDAGAAGPSRHVDSRAVRAVHAARRRLGQPARRAGRCVLKTLAHYAPDIERRVVHRQILTPLDLERDLGLTRRPHPSRRARARSAVHDAADARLGALRHARSPACFSAAPARTLAAGFTARAGRNAATGDTQEPLEDAMRQREDVGERHLTCERRLCALRIALLCSRPPSIAASCDQAVIYGFTSVTRPREQRPSRRAFSRQVERGSHRRLSQGVRREAARRGIAARPRARGVDARPLARVRPRGSRDHGARSPASVAGRSDRRDDRAGAMARIDERGADRRATRHTQADVGLPYHAYSAPLAKSPRRSFMRAAATRRDYDWLRSQGIDIKGKIALVRYSVPYSYRGFKALTAQQRGAAGILIYSDPGRRRVQEGQGVSGGSVGTRRATSSAAASCSTSWCPAIR